jgi:CRP-like cAMP-binding protein
MTESILQKFELFKLFKTEELTVLEKALFIQNLKSDQILFSEGQKPEYFYLLIEGKAHIIRHTISEECLLISW